MEKEKVSPDLESYQLTHGYQKVYTDWLFGLLVSIVWGKIYVGLLSKSTKNEDWTELRACQTL